MSKGIIYPANGIGLKQKKSLYKGLKKIDIQNVFKKLIRRCCTFIRLTRVPSSDAHVKSLYIFSEVLKTHKTIIENLPFARGYLLVVPLEFPDSSNFT